MVAAVSGVRVGHWTGDGTGVTVVLLPEGTVGSCEVRGGAPATRETALLDPTKMVQAIDAVVLAGGSAFGLATATRHPGEELIQLHVSILSQTLSVIVSDRQRPVPTVLPRSSAPRVTCGPGAVRCRDNRRAA